jgi:L-ascorbate metabolism protein UlaG (beta-lactamase superfamily)
MRAKIICLGLLLIFAYGFVDARAAEPKKNEIQITWLGHAAFELLSSGGTDILIDP